MVVLQVLRSYSCNFSGQTLPSMTSPRLQHGTQTLLSVFRPYLATVEGNCHRHLARKIPTERDNRHTTNFGAIVRPAQATSDQAVMSNRFPLLLVRRPDEGSPPSMPQFAEKAPKIPVVKVADNSAKHTNIEHA